MASSAAIRAIALLSAALAACGGSKDSPPASACDVFVEARCIDATRMKADVAELASARYAGRRAGTEGNAAAVALAETRLAAALEPAPGRSGYLQSFSFEHWEPSAARLSLGAATAALGTGFEVLYDSGAGAIEDAELVFVGYGLRVPPYAQEAYPACPLPATGYDDYAGVEVAGKIVVVLRGYPGDDPNVTLCPPDPEICGVNPTCYQRSSYRTRAAYAEGAAGVLQAGPLRPFGSAGVAWLPSLLVDPGLLASVVPALPGWKAAIDANLAPSSHATGVLASMTVEGGYRELQASNVVGVVPGADPALKDEVVVVGAHLDHMGKLPFRSEFFPGADDNASGTALVLELARAVAASPTRPRRTLVFALWNAEELGLLGSRWYVAAEPLLPLASTVAAFSVDMVGAGDPGLELWHGDEYPWMPALVTAGAADLGLPATWPVYSRPELTASDHYFFLAAGVPAFLASTPEILSHPTYHTADDVAAGVSRENLESSAKLLWSGIRELAMGAEIPAASGVAKPRAPGADALRDRPRASPVGPGFLRD